MKKTKGFITLTFILFVMVLITLLNITWHASHSFIYYKHEQQLRKHKNIQSIVLLLLTKGQQLKRMATYAPWGVVEYNNMAFPYPKNAHIFVDGKEKKYRYYAGYIPHKEVYIKKQYAYGISRKPLIYLLCLGSPQQPYPHEINADNTQREHTKKSFCVDTRGLPFFALVAVCLCPTKKSHEANPCYTNIVEKTLCGHTHNIMVIPHKPRSPFTPPEDYTDSTI